MMIDYTKKDKVKFTMYGYTYYLIEKLPTDMKGTSVLSTMNYLF